MPVWDHIYMVYDPIPGQHLNVVGGGGEGVTYR